jgi:hypothetical protein
MVGATATDERGRSYNHSSEERFLVTVDDRLKGENGPRRQTM